MSNAGSLSVCLSQSLPFWSILSAQQRQLLLSNTTLCKYAAGTRIYELGSIFEGLLVLHTGRLRAFIFSPDSREATLFTLQEGEMSVLALKEIRAQCGVELCFEVLEPSELLCVHESAFFVLYHTVPRVQQDILSASFSHLNALLRAVNVQAFYPLRKRLAMLLLERAEQTGSDTLSVTHEELARALRAAREMVSVELENMRKAGLLASTRGKIRLLDKAGIEQETKLCK